MDEFRVGKTTPDQTGTNSPKLSVIIITGFLGAGKTSFVSQLLKVDGMSNSAVIINEFGKIGLDHIIIDSLNEQIFDLPNGCLCCSSSTALVEKLTSLSSQNDNGMIDIDRVIIETSGVSDASNLVQMLWNSNQVRSSFELGKIITIISATEWRSSKSGFQEVESQLAISDAVIISKTDLLPKTSADTQIAHLTGEIELLSAKSDIFISPLSTQQFKEFIEPSEKQSGRAEMHRMQDHDTGIYKTCTLSTGKPLSAQTVSLFLDIITTHHADKLLRIKGLVLTVEDPTRPMIIQTVKSTITPFSWLKQWSEKPETKIVLIHTHRESSLFFDLFHSITDEPAIDQPDKQALSNNPLSITGWGSFKPE